MTATNINPITLNKMKTITINPQRINNLIDKTMIEFEYTEHETLKWWAEYMCDKIGEPMKGLTYIETYQMFLRIGEDIVDGKITDKYVLNLR